MANKEDRLPIAPDTSPPIVVADDDQAAPPPAVTEGDRCADASMERVMAILFRAATVADAAEQEASIDRTRRDLAALRRATSATSARAAPAEATGSNA